MFVKKEKKPSVDLDRLLIGPQSPATVWVNSLLMYMVKDSVSHFMFRKSDGIPLIPLDNDDVLDGEISFDAIINRLKVFAGFDPVIYHERKEGCELLISGGNRYIIKVLFDDFVDDPRYQINLSIAE